MRAPRARTRFLDDRAARTTPLGDGARHLAHSHGEAVERLFDMSQRDGMRRHRVRVA
jgi:hypothetical protein